MTTSGDGSSGRPPTRLEGGRDAADYNRRHSGRTVYGPMVCVCAVPLAHPRINYGECYRCHRKPLALFASVQRSAPPVAPPSHPTVA